MYVLKAENRDPNLKAKKLKKAGIIPGCVYGSSIEKSNLIQIQQNDAQKFLKTNSVGCKVALEVGGKKTNALLKEVNLSPLGNQIEHLSFQALVEGEKVLGTAQIILVNREKVADFVQQVQFEISYRALPSDLIDKVVIDLDGMKAGSSVRVEDIELFKNEDIELLTAPDSLIFTIVESKKAPSDAEEPEQTT